MRCRGQDQQHPVTRWPWSPVGILIVSLIRHWQGFSKERMQTTE